MPTGVYPRTKPAWNKGMSTPGNKCAEGCTCGRQRKVETFRQETGKTLVVVYQTELSGLKYEDGGQN